MSSFPPASIIQKLKDIDPDAPEWVMKRMDEIQAFHHKKPAIQTNWRAFRDGITDVFRLSPRPLTDFKKSDTIAESWQTVGDYMRMAVSDYMAKHNLTSLDINLTETECEALKLIILSDFSKQNMAPE